MPIKSYKCNNCGHKFEQLLLTQEAEHSIACPTCSSNQLTRSFWEQTVSMGAHKSTECCMGINSSECPSSTPGGGCGVFGN